MNINKKLNRQYEGFVARLDAIEGNQHSDIEQLHWESDAILLEAVGLTSPSVQAAYERARNRVGFYYS